MPLARPSRGKLLSTDYLSALPSCGRGEGAIPGTGPAAAPLRPAGPGRSPRARGGGRCSPSRPAPPAGAGAPAAPSPEIAAPRPRSAWAAPRGSAAAGGGAEPRAGRVPLPSAAGTGLIIAEPSAGGAGRAPPPHLLPPQPACRAAPAAAHTGRTQLLAPPAPTFSACCALRASCPPLAARHGAPAGMGAAGQRGW